MRTPTYREIGVKIGAPVFWILQRRLERFYASLFTLFLYFSADKVKLKSSDKKGFLTLM